MSTNSAPLRRILRSIGSRATPASVVSRSPSNLCANGRHSPSNTRPISQAHGVASRCDTTPRDHRGHGGIRQHQSFHNSARVKEDHREAPVHSDGKGSPRSHAGTAEFHDQNPSQSVEDRAKETPSAHAAKTKYAPKRRKGPQAPGTSYDDQRSRQSSKSLADASEDIPKDELEMKTQHASKRRTGPQSRGTSSEDQGYQRSPKSLAGATEDLPRNELETIVDSITGHSRDLTWAGNWEKGEFSRQYFGSFEDKKKNVSKNWEEGEFSLQYFDSFKGTKDNKLLKRAQRRKLSRDRHRFDEKTAWGQILESLQQGSRPGAHWHLKRTETMWLPKGTCGEWTRDAGEAILEIALRTGSHVQSLHGVTRQKFSALHIWGKPDQNKAAKRMLQDLDLWRPVDEDALDDGTADYAHISEHSERHDVPKPAASLDGLWLSDDTDGVDAESLHDVNTVHSTIAPPTRSTWSRKRALGESAWVGEDRSWRDDIFPQKQELSSSVNAISLANRVTELSFDRIGKFKSITDRHSELVRLLTEPENAPFITPSAIIPAFQFLARHMFFPSVRSILDAFGVNKVELTAEVFFPLLAAAAKGEDVLAFHNIIHIMRKRAVAPDASTWFLFHLLTKARFPKLRNNILAEIGAKQMTLSAKTKIQNVEMYAVKLWNTYAQDHPDATVKEFAQHIDDDIPGRRWLTPFVVNRVCHRLLERGQTQLAFDVVDELVSRGGRPDTVTLNTFLSSAKRAKSLTMAVELLRRFHDLHAKSTPLARREGTEALPRAHDLQIAVNKVTMQALLSIAWRRRWFNAFRVFWRFAACTGLLSPGIKRLVHAFVLRASLTRPSLKLLKKGTKDASARRLLWETWAPRFAVGVHSGLAVHGATDFNGSSKGQGPGSTEVAIKKEPAESSVASAVTLAESEIAFLNENLTSSGAKPKGSEKTRFSREDNKAFRSKLLELYVADVSRGQTLRPLTSLVTLAEQALKRDLAWRASQLGTPSGLARRGTRKNQRRKRMYDAMVRDAVDVPVEVRDPQDPKELRLAGFEVLDETDEAAGLITEEAKE